MRTERSDEDAVRRHVGSFRQAHGTWVSPDPLCMQGHERFPRPAARRHPRGSHCPDAARAETTDARGNLAQPLDLYPIGQLHDQRPSVAEMPVPEHVVFVAEQVREIVGRASDLLQQRDISANPHHGCFHLVMFRLTSLIIRRDLFSRCRGLPVAYPYRCRWPAVHYQHTIGLLT